MPDVFSELEQFRSCPFSCTFRKVNVYICCVLIVLTRIGHKSSKAYVVSILNVCICAYTRMRSVRNI